MKTKAVFLGFGARAQCYANYIFSNENTFEVAAVAEPKRYLQELANEKYRCNKENIYKDWKELDIETWRGLEELYKAGKVKAIGVSNFLLHHLENLIQNCEIMPMADQIEFHPGFTQEATVRYCQEKGIYVQAWSPLGRKRVLEHPLLVGLAEKYNKSAAQICLRYEIQRQVIPLPKASTKERMVQNYQVFDFEIEKEDMYRIDSMQPAGWSGEHPDFPRVK